MISIKGCSPCIFLKSFIVPIFRFRSLNCWEFNFVCGIREYSNFTGLFIVWESATLSSRVAVCNLHSQHQCGRVPFSPYCLQHLSFVGFLPMAILTSVSWYRGVALVCISVIFRDADVFSCDFVKGCEWNVSLEIGFLNFFSVLDFLAMTMPRTFPQGRWILLRFPKVLWILNVHQHTFSGLPWWFRWQTIWLQCQRPGFDPRVRKIPWRMDTHSSILAWETPWSQEPGRLQSTGSQSQTRLSHKHTLKVAIAENGHKAAAFLHAPHILYNFIYIVVV